MKQQIQTSTAHLANLCLLQETKHNEYTDTDLMNATIIFSHFLESVIFTANQYLPQEKREDPADLIGKALRELIKASSGKDMHLIAKK